MSANFWGEAGPRATSTRIGYFASVELINTRLLWGEKREQHARVKGK